MQVRKWVISLSNRKDFTVDEETKDNLIALIDQGNRLISLGNALINPAFIVSIEKTEDYNYTDSSHQIETGSHNQTEEEFQRASRVAEEVRQRLIDKGLV